MWIINEYKELINLDKCGVISINKYSNVEYKLCCTIDGVILHITKIHTKELCEKILGDITKALSLGVKVFNIN